MDVSSDIDVVADRPVREVMTAAHVRWAERHLYPIILWPYDVGGTGSIFLVNDGATEGVQIDVLHDIHGRGQYGFISGELLGHTVNGRRFPRLDEEATKLYLARKRQVKGQETPRNGVADELAHQLLSPAAAHALLDPSAIGGRGMSLSRVRRLVDRVAKPIGAWIHISAADSKTSLHAASVLSGRVARCLPHVDSAALEPFPGRIRWWAERVAPIRWRPGVFISWSAADEPTPIGCDIAIDHVVDPEMAAERAVRDLRGRLLE